MEKLRNGFDFVHLIGSVVSLDAEDQHGKFTVNGILVGTLDRYVEDDATETILTIGADRIVLDWTDERTKARIVKMEA